MKNKSFNIANMLKYGYICRALSKISKLAVEGYKSQQAYSPLRAFFVREISMRSHVMVKLEGDTFECASYLSYWSTNPFQLCHHNYLVVIGKAPINSGAH